MQKAPKQEATSLSLTLSPSGKSVSQVGYGKVKWMCFPNRKTAIGTAIDLYLRRPGGAMKLADAFRVRSKVC